MPDYDWNLVRSFLAVLDKGSLAAATRTVGISQPTLGRHIDELEKSLGVVLFERGRSGMMPTAAGLEIAEAAKGMEAAGNALLTAASGTSEAVSGTVRITASEIVATYILPDIIRDMLRDLPDIEVELAPSNTVDNLLRRDADIAVRMVRPIQNDLITRKVNEMQMGIYARQDYLDRNGPVETFDDMQSRTVIGYDRDDLIIRGFAGFGFKIDRSFFRYRCDDQVTAFEALVAGVGIGFAPRVLAARHSKLVRLLEGFEIEALPMWLTAHRELRTSARIRAVNDYLGKNLAAMDLG